MALLIIPRFLLYLLKPHHPGYFFLSFCSYPECSHLYVFPHVPNLQNKRLMQILKKKSNNKKDKDKQKDLYFQV